MKIKSLFMSKRNSVIWQTDEIDFVISKSALLKIKGKTYVISLATLDPVEHTAIYLLHEKEDTLL